MPVAAGRARGLRWVRRGDVIVALLWREGGGGV